MNQDGVNKARMMKYGLLLVVLGVFGFALGEPLGAGFEDFV